MTPPRSIAFVCGSAGPGASGVGDYALGLAAALRTRGFDSRVLAVCDREAAAVPRDDPVEWQGILVPCRRLPAGLPPKGASMEIESWLAAFAPAWVSVQFVPFAFHPKGLATHSGIPWRSFGRHSIVHLMFHEVWVGDYLGAPWALRMWGRWQRHSVRRVVRCLRPRVVHTSNAFYRHLLQGTGIPASILPIFGNIPVSAGQPRHREEVDEWIGGFFGTIHPGFPAEHGFELLRRRAAQMRRRLRILSVGRAGPGEADFRSWRLRWPDIKFDCIGTQPPEVVSQTLAGLDFGLSSTPLNIIGKSGSAAALIEHGIPVLCGSLGSGTRGYQAGRRDAAPGAFLLEDYIGSGLDLTEARPPVGSRLGFVSQRFLEELEAAGVQ